MPVKDGDKVYFKIASGEIRTGKYDAKTKMVMMAGGKKAKPPKKALHHTRKGAMDNPFVKLTSGSDILGAPKRYTTKNVKEKPTPKKKVSTAKDEELTDDVKEKKNLFMMRIKGIFGQKDGEPIGKKIYVITRSNRDDPEKTSVVAGTIEGFSNKGIIIRADKGKVVKKDTSRKLGGENYFRTSYMWEKTSGKPTKKVISWNNSRKTEKYDGVVPIKTIGG